MKRYCRNLMVMALATGIFIMFASLAHATFQVTLVSGLSSLTAIDNVLNDTNPNVGEINVVGSVGVFTTNSAFVVSPVPGLGSASIDTNAFHATSTAAGVLTVTATNGGFSFAPFPAYTLSGNIGGTTNLGGNTVTYDIIYDPTNATPGSAPPGTLLNVPIQYGPGNLFGGNASTTLLPPLGNPFSLTQTMVITHAGVSSTSYNADASVKPVPEPTTLILLGVGLAGLAGYGWRRKKKQS